MSLLVICETLGHFVITLTANGKYSLHYRKNLPQVLQMQLSKKQTFFLTLLLYFWDLNQILKILKNIWASWVTYYQYFRLPKTWLDKCLNRAVSGNPLRVTCWDVGNTAEICMIALISYFSTTLREIEQQNVSDSDAWNLMAVSYHTDWRCKYSLHYRKNLSQPVQMKLSKKQKTFSEFFAAFLKSTSSFQNFEQKRLPS